MTTLSKGTAVQVIGNVFPNVKGIVTNVEDDRVDLVFKMFIQDREIWDTVSLPIENVKAIDNSKDYVFYNNEPIEYDEDIQE